MTFNPTTISASMSIPATLDGISQDVLKVIQNTVISLTRSSAIQDEETARRHAKHAKTAFVHAALSNHLTEVQEDSLFKKTGLRHSQTVQFTREQYVLIIEVLSKWYKKATKSAKIVVKNESQIMAQNALMDLGVDITPIQGILSGLSDGDAVTIRKNGTRASLVFDRGGKRAAAMYDGTDDSFTKQTQGQVKAFNSLAMQHGRAKRIAREALRLGGLENIKGKADVKFIREQRGAIEKAMAELTGKTLT